jgi:hypothetical protein
MKTKKRNDSRVTADYTRLAVVGVCVWLVDSELVGYSQDSE